MLQGQDATKLPVKSLNPLLDEYGIEQTWESLIYTHAAHSYPQHHGGILTAPEFDDAITFDDDLLTGLSVGNISVMYEYSLAYVDADSRKDQGQFFTPDDVAARLAQFSTDFDSGVWLDPCSGVGNLSIHLALIQPDPVDFALHQLYLVDKDPLALLIARSLLTLGLAEYGNHNIFEQLLDRMVVADFLSDDLPEYDYAILNPPYVVVPEDRRFKTAASRDLYAYFLERVMDASRGHIAITPQSFTHSEKFVSLRQMMIDRLQHVEMYSFDNIPDNIFRGVKFGSKNTNKANSIRPTIMVARESDETVWYTSPFLRWQKNERDLLFDSLENYRTPFEPDVRFFPKVGSDLVALYSDMQTYHQTIANLTSEYGSFLLSVPSTTRYFIPATKRTLDRTSVRVLRFNTEAQRDLAYLLMNSSYFYWWWRVVDGGMSVSTATMMSLPVPPHVTVDPDLVARLEASEQTNLVSKQNSGKANENVKHDLSLIAELNCHLFSEETAAALLASHNNNLGIYHEEDSVLCRL